ADESDDLAVDECGEHLELGTLDGPAGPQFGHALGRDLLKSGSADEVVVGFVPAGGVDTTEGLGIHISNGPDDDGALQFGFHGQTLRAPGRRRKSTRNLSMAHNGMASRPADRYHRPS